MRATGKGGEHISGAEGLFAGAEVQKAVRDFSLRAASHSRGAPEKIVLTVEKLKRRPKEIKSLPAGTLQCESPEDADAIARSILTRLGVSGRAITAALGVLRRGKAMRGAALLEAATGRRLEPDRGRGVRASRMGIGKNTLAALSRRLGQRGINTPAVREALVLASKVASAGGVLAELCVSDDPEYTTGYLACRKLGYLRIPNIKRTGSRQGGRVFFIRSDADLNSVISYIEDMPVLVTALSAVNGTSDALPGKRKTPL